MDNQDLLTEIAYRASDEVLLLFSRIPSVWNLLSSTMQKQNFWYRRTLEAFNLPLEYQTETGEDWHQIYNILTLIRDGNNPFSTEKKNLDILELNKYNLTAVKILLELGYDPSVDGSQTLRGIGMYGSPEAVQLLLDDKRINLRPTDVLQLTAEAGRVDNMKVLLADKRIQDLISENDYYIITVVLESAANGNEVEVFEEMLDYCIEQDLDEVEFWVPLVASEAARAGNVGILNALLERDLLHPDRSMINLAINNDQAEALTILLDRAKYLSSQDEEVEIPSEEDMSKTAISSSSPKIVRMFIENGYLSKLSIDRVLSRAIHPNRAREKRAFDVLDIILEEDPRISQSQDMITRMLNTGIVIAARIPGIFQVALAKSRYVNIDKLSRDARGIIMMESNEARDSLEKISQLTQISYQEVWSIMSTIDTENGNFNKYHFEMLLIEIVIKRLDLEYYLDWIIAHLSRRDTNQELRDLFSAAAESILTNKRVIHTSDLFTAYSGFLMLANSKDTEAIMNLLREELSEHSEEGVTQEGLKKAGLLLGAFSI